MEFGSGTGIWPPPVTLTGRSQVGGVGVLVGVFVGVFVGVLVGVLVGVFVGVGVQAKTLGEFVVPPDTGRLILVSVPLALTLSVKKASAPPQGGAVSSMLPLQVSVAVP